MLILVAVTIQVVINSGLLKTAGDAVSDYKNEQEQESNLNEVEVNGYNSIEEYLESINGGNPPPPPTTIGPGDKANETTEYEDSNGDIAVIPGDFTVSGLEDESKIDDGLVIYLIPDGVTVDWENGAEVANAQKTYDQFVWIPISHTQINNMYICQAKTGSNGNCNIEVVNGEAKCTVHSSTQMAGRLYATTCEENFEKAITEVYTANEGLREPDVVTGNNTGNGTSYDGSSTNLEQLSSILGTIGYDTTANFKQSLQEEYNEVVKSVYENQGFYIGRYETSNMVDSNTNTTVKSVAGTTTGISNVTWYRMYGEQKKHAENNGLTSVKSTMIQGAAYDQVIKFIENGTRPDGSSYTIKTSGNALHNKDYFEDGPWQTAGLNYADIGQYNDKVKNIYDLEGNITAWTTETYFNDYRVYRGRILLFKWICK